MGTGVWVAFLFLVGVVVITVGHAIAPSLRVDAQLRGGTLELALRTDCTVISRSSRSSSESRRPSRVNAVLEVEASGVGVVVQRVKLHGDDVRGGSVRLPLQARIAAVQLLLLNSG